MARLRRRPHRPPSGGGDDQEEAQDRAAGRIAAEDQAPAADPVDNLGQQIVFSLDLQGDFLGLSKKKLHPTTDTYPFKIVYRSGLGFHDA